MKPADANDNPLIIQARTYLRLIMDNADRLDTIAAMLDKVRRTASQALTYKALSKLGFQGELSQGQSDAYAFNFTHAELETNDRGRNWDKTMDQLITSHYMPKEQKAFVQELARLANELRDASQLAHTLHLGKSWNFYDRDILKFPEAIQKTINVLTAIANKTENPDLKSNAANQLNFLNEEITTKLGDDFNNALTYYIDNLTHLPKDPINQGKRWAEGVAAITKSQDDLEKNDPEYAAKARKRQPLNIIERPTR